jgi:hypothetical protein
LDWQIGKPNESSSAYIYRIKRLSLVSTYNIHIALAYVIFVRTHHIFFRLSESFYILIFDFVFRMNTVDSNGFVLTYHDVKNIERQTKLTTDKIYAFYAEFLNRYPNGINEFEFETSILNRLLHREKGECAVKHEQADIASRIFHLCDQDQNGTIDFKEYLVLFWCQTNGQLCGKLEFLFKLFDRFVWII